MHGTAQQLHTITSGGIQAPDNSRTGDGSAAAFPGCCRAATPGGPDGPAECAPQPGEITVDGTEEHLAPAATIAHLSPGDRLLVMLDPRLDEPEIRLLMDSLGRSFPGVEFVGSAAIQGAMILPAAEATGALPALRDLADATRQYLRSAPPSVSDEEGMRYRALADAHNAAQDYLNAQEG